MYNPFNLNKKTIIITGASSGIGRQCAISCSKMGARVILIARNEERLKEVITRMDGSEHIIYAFDITEFDKIEEIVKDAVNKIGKISGFIHSAGIEKTLPVKMMNPQIYQELFNINVIAGFEFARIISQKRYLGEDASFVFVSSIMSVLGQSAKTGYCSSKAAIIGGVKALALEFITKNIRVNSISPAIVKTEMSNNFFDSLSEDEKKSIIDMHPLGLGEPEDIANACIFLLSDASKWVTGTNLIVDGGYCAK